MKPIPLAPDADKATRTKARVKVNNEIRAGRLSSIRTQRCVLCDAAAETYHHESYAVEDWLKVIPLCMSCHRMVHSPNRDNFVMIKTHNLRREMADFDKSDWLPLARKEALITEWERRIYYLRGSC